MIYLNIRFYRKLYILFTANDVFMDIGKFDEGKEYKKIKIDIKSM